MGNEDSKGCEMIVELYVFHITGTAGINSI